MNWKRKAFYFASDVSALLFISLAQVLSVRALVGLPCVLNHDFLIWWGLAWLSGIAGAGLVWLRE